MAEVAYRSAQCSELTEIVSLIEANGDWRDWLARQPESPAAIDQPDFSAGRVVIVAMGQQPNAGYSLGLADERVELRQGAATIRVAWRTPAPDTIVAQVLTSPCMAVYLASTAVDSVNILKQ